MGLRPVVALFWSVLLCGGALAWLLPLTTGLPPLVLPEIYGPFVPQHAYRASGMMLLAPVAVSILTFILCTGLYFWLTALPRTLRYRPMRRRGRSSSNLARRQHCLMKGRPDSEVTCAARSRPL